MSKVVKQELIAPSIDGIYESQSGHVPGIVSLGITALKADPMEGMVISTERLQTLATECVLNDFNYSWVSLKDGEVVAALCALVVPSMVYERKMATVVQFYTVAPGEGEKLMRHFLEWRKERKRFIKMVAFTLEMGADPRIGKLLTRMGLTETMPVYCDWG
jgi:hypothetical protein